MERNDNHQQLTRVADALTTIAAPKRDIRPWWRKVPYRDITIVFALVGFLFTVRGEISKAHEVGNRAAVSDAVIKSIQNINEDILFRNLHSDGASQVRNQLIELAKTQSPNDPLVITLALFSKQVDLTRDPYVKDGPTILALARYPVSIDPKRISADLTSMKIYNEWLNISSAALLTLVVKNDELQASAKGEVYYRLAYECLVKASAYVSNRSDLLNTYLLLIQHKVRGLLYGFPAMADRPDFLKLADHLVNDLRESKDPKERRVAVEASAALLHLRGQMAHVAGNYAAAARDYEQALSEYKTMAKTFVGRRPSVEMDLVKAHLENAKHSEKLGAH